MECLRAMRFHEDAFATAETLCRARRAMSPAYAIAVSEDPSVQQATLSLRSRSRRVNRMLCFPSFGVGAPMLILRRSGEMTGKWFFFFRGRRKY